ncbi:hypothetical protein BAY61_03640 [Prauserella marina]|nr:hypothetical protein BAY61_03640 [Prauserella marina]
MRVLSVLAGVLVVLVVLVGLGGSVGGPFVPSAAAAQPVVAAAGPLTPVLNQETPEPGPVLDPQTEADAENTKSKVIVGVAAGVLLVAVIWGRRIRAKRTKKK